MKFRNALLGLLFVCVLSSCASVLKNIDSNVVPDGNMSVVVGRLQLTYNGDPVEPKPRRGYIIYHINPFTGVNNLNTNPFSAGEIAIKVNLNEEGYFAVPLPPGRYYVLSFNFGYQAKLIFFRTLRPSSQYENQRLWFATFEVLPGKATYIGTINNHVGDLPSDKPKTEVWSLKLQITDESSVTREWFNKTYPSWSGQMSTSLATIQLLN
jgi:hypothetical protein